MDVERRGRVGIVDAVIGGEGPVGPFVDEQQVGPGRVGRVSDEWERVRADEGDRA